VNDIPVEAARQIVEALIANWQGKQYSLLVSLRVQKKIREVLQDKSADDAIAQIESDLRRVEIALDELGAELSTLDAGEQ